MPHPSNTQPICVAGAGFSAAVIACQLARAGYRVEVHESRDHIGGNCYTHRDAATGILVHRYGPHVFHTDNAEVWQFINEFARFQPYVHRVKAVHADQVYSFPVNLHTINQLYQQHHSPSTAAALVCTEALILGRAAENFEEQALSMVGERLYRAFFYGYTLKQWGCEPRELSASIFRRLPLRFNYDDAYFSHPFQGLPENGYTPIFEKLLDQPNISIHLGSTIERKDTQRFSHTFYSGPIDRYFNYQLGELGYRTLDFVEEVHKGDYQGCAVVNYTDADVPFTRITEYKHFSPWEQHDGTLIAREYSRPAAREDTPYYPVRRAQDKVLLQAYRQQAEKEKNVTFVGRLGTYRYLDMDKTIEEALFASRQFLKFRQNKMAIPAFFHSSL